MFVSIVLFATAALAVQKRAMTCKGLPCVPGTDSLGIGIDVVTGDFKAQSLFEYTFNQDKLWTNPFHHTLQYSVPDQVDVTTQSSSGSTSNLFRTSTEYANKLSHGAGVEGGYGAVFSGSAAVSHAKTFLSSGNTVLSVTEEVLKLNSLSLMPTPLLNISSSLLTAIQQHLPVVYDERAYATFVSYYGTHYVTSATYGGKATMMSSVQNNYLGENSDLVANANAKVHFQAMKGADVGAAFSHSSSSNDYQNACTNSWSTRMVGGNSHLKMSQWEQWTDSVKLAPAQISFRVVSLDRIMPDEHRASNFRTYLQNYYQANNHTEVAKPKPPIRMNRCQCTSFPYDGTNPLPEGLVVGMDPGRKNRIGGTRRVCVPCYSLSGKFGNTQSKKKRSTEKRQAAPTPGPNPKPARTSCGAEICLPGLDHIGVGFDARYGEMRDLRVIDFTYNDKNKWTNPFYKQLVYNYADQVNVVTKTESNKLNAIYNDTVQYASDLAQKAGLSGTAGAYSASLDVQQSRDKLAGSQAILAVLEQELTIYEVDLKSYPTPSGMITLMEQWLPTQYVAQAYKHFVSHFGTHFIAEARFGGTARQRSTVDQHFFTTNAGNSVSAGVNGQYANFQAGVKVNRTSSQGMQAFSNNSISEITLLGGNYERIKVSDWDAWQESTRYAPAATSIKLHPIYELFQDSTKAANMKQHVDEYMQAGLKMFKPVAVSTQHPENSGEYTVKDGENCLDHSKQGFLQDFKMNVPFLHNALSPQQCRTIGWSKAPRGSLSVNRPMVPCGTYTINATSCENGGFMRGATYLGKNPLGTWATPITCSHLCYAQE